MGGLPSTFADIRALMVAESWWAKEFFENSQDIGAVRKSATITNTKLLMTLPSMRHFRVPFARLFFHEIFVTLSCSLPGERAWHIANKACTLSVGMQKMYHQNDAGKGFTNSNYRISYWLLLVWRCCIRTMKLRVVTKVRMVSR